MRRFLVLSLVLGLGACAEEAGAPLQGGVCWLQVKGVNGRPDYRPLATGIENLETCAARLEGLRLKHGGEVIGAFQGRFVFVDAAAITSATAVNGHGYRVFSPEQRAEIADGYRRLGSADR